MKYIRFVTVLVAGLVAIGCQKKPAGNRAVATICQTDALFNVLPQICVPVMPDDTLRVARGENAVAQFEIGRAHV